MRLAKAGRNKHRKVKAVTSVIWALRCSPRFSRCCEDPEGRPWWRWLITDTWQEISSIFHLSCLSQSHSGSSQYCLPCSIFATPNKTDVYLIEDSLKTYFMFSENIRFHSPGLSASPVGWTWVGLQASFLPFIRNATLSTKDHVLLNLPGTCLSSGGIYLGGTSAAKCGIHSISEGGFLSSLWLPSAGFREVTDPFWASVCSSATNQTKADPSQGPEEDSVNTYVPAETSNVFVIRPAYYLPLLCPMISWPSFQNASSCSHGQRAWYWAICLDTLQVCTP